MSKEYIERGALQEALQRKKAGVANARYTDGWNDCLMRVKSMVSTAKAADVVEVKHGRWIKHDNYLHGHYIDTHYECSVCNKLSDIPYHYCPNCGAKMDLPVPCSDVECAPPYGDKEDCELNKGGFCGAKMDGE